MRKNIYLLSFLLILFFWGCSKENPVAPGEVETSGSVLLKIDRENTPQSVATVTATFIRSGYQSITAMMNIHPDSTADLRLNGIASGNWLLKVEAKNQAGVVEYYGETQINIVPSQIIQVYLTLYPVAGSTGGIHLVVSWGAKWSEFSGNPVLSPQQNPSNPNAVGQSRIIYDNGIYKMWYTAVYNNAVASVWYAESPDGKNWTTIGSQPVLTKGAPGSWDSYTVGATHVFKEGDTYKMYYNGFSGHPFQTSWKIGYATSPDGINWTKHPTPVIQESGLYYRPGMNAVIKKDNLYYGFFGYSNSTFTKYQIGLATSPDGINWTMNNSNPVLSPNLGWESNGVTYPSVYYDGTKFRLFYMNKGETAFGYAESLNGIDFFKDYQPVFTKQQTNWAYLSYPSYIKVNNIQRIYFTAGYNQYSYSVCFIQK
jgi:predicted GH43/DUF377 family glycosyl hydrolase